MTKRTIKLWVLSVPLALLLSAAVACGSDGAKDEVTGGSPTAVVGEVVETEAGSYINASPQELSSMLDNKDFTLINVLSGYVGEIEDTDLFIAYDELAARRDDLPAESDAKIVVYCRSGASSAAAAQTLLGMGYTNVWNLDGGMLAWVEAGYELQDAR